MQISQIAVRTLKPGADQELILKSLGTSLIPHINELIEAFVVAGGSRIHAQKIILAMVCNLMYGRIKITPSNQLAFALLCKLLKDQALELTEGTFGYMQARHLAVLFRTYVEIAIEKSAKPVEA